MSIRIIFCLLAVIFPRVGHAESPKEFIEFLPAGCINWTQGVLEAKGVCPPLQASVQNAVQSETSLQQACQQARTNVLHVLMQVRMSADRRVSSVMAADERISARILHIADSAPVVSDTCLPDGALEVTVRLRLLGGLAQLMLPEEIRQVESIRSIQLGSASPSRNTALADGEYTGLIVDARGIGAQPAMVPLLVDENGKEVYGSAFVSREYAVQYGVCEYMRSLDDPTLQVRVAPKPLLVKGLRTLSERKSDIVISNADAARLRGASANLGFLKQCRVIMVLD